jgi:hypothetical protein
MIRYAILCLLIVISGAVNAHQFMPTYPKFEQSFVGGVLSTKMELFNKRAEVEYYEIQVFDADWNKVPFASEAKIVQVKYLETKTINVYIRNEDIMKAVYVCTESKMLRQDSKYTIISSRVCSKVK